MKSSEMSKSSHHKLIATLLFTNEINKEKRGLE
jgi:hypothetical protein